MNIAGSMLFGGGIWSASDQEWYSWLLFLAMGLLWYISGELDCYVDERMVMLYTKKGMEK